MDLWESDWQWSLGGMPARLPTASWLSDFLNCEGVAVHPWEEPDAYLQAIFDHGTGVHEASATRYVGLDPIVEPNSRIDIESRVGAALIPELEPISEAGVVEAAFELLPDKVVAHVVTDGKMPRKAQHGGLFGRMDYVGKDIDGRLWVLDLKTGNPDYLQMPLLAWQLRHYACHGLGARGQAMRPAASCPMPPSGPAAENTPGARGRQRAPAAAPPDPPRTPPLPCSRPGPPSCEGPSSGHRSSWPAPLPSTSPPLASAPVAAPRRPAQRPWLPSGSKTCL